MIWKIGLPAICLLVCLPLFMYYKKSLQYALGAMFKTCGTLCALIPALVAAMRLDPHCWICVIALVLHAAADYILEFNMYIGAGLFAAGHICYIAFFTTLFPVSTLHMVCLICLVALSAAIMWRWRQNIGKKMSLMAVYVGILCVMCACAVGCFSGASTAGILIACGGALFFVSDAMLCRRLFFSAPRPVDWAIMITYYCAQLLFGFSCMYI